LKERRNVAPVLARLRARADGRRAGDGEGENRAAPDRDPLDSVGPI